MYFFFIKLTFKVITPLALCTLYLKVTKVQTALDFSSTKYYISKTKFNFF